MLTNNKLLKNTVMLYILMFSSYFFSLITVPYISRILGPDYYGKVGFAQALMNYVKLVVDFGFILSATEEVSKNRNDKLELSKIFSAVTVSKLILSIFCFFILFIYLRLNIHTKSDYLLYIFSYLMVVTSSLLPDFFYRGIEKMEIITIRAVAIQFLSVILVFSLLRSDSDYYLVPFFYVVGNIIALIFIYYDVIFKMKIGFVKVSSKYVINTIKKSSMFFLSRIAGTIYSSTNIVALGIFYSVSNPIVGYYTASDKLLTTIKGGITPISDSLYPYMVQYRDFKKMKNILLITIPVSAVVCFILYFFSNEVVFLLFGKAYKESATIFRIMIPIIFITPFSYFLGFPMMSPLGLAKYANLSTIFASIIQVTLLGISLYTKIFNVYILCVITIISELFIVLYRIYILYKYRFKYIIKKEA